VYEGGGPRSPRARHPPPGASSHTTLELPKALGLGRAKAKESAEDGAARDVDGVAIGPKSQAGEGDHRRSRDSWGWGRQDRGDPQTQDTGAGLDDDRGAPLEGRVPGAPDAARMPPPLPRGRPPASAYPGEPPPRRASPRAPVPSPLHSHPQLPESSAPSAGAGREVCHDDGAADDARRKLSRGGRVSPRPPPGSPRLPFAPRLRLEALREAVPPSLPRAQKHSASRHDASSALVLRVRSANQRPGSGAGEFYVPSGTGPLPLPPGPGANGPGAPRLRLPAPRLHVGARAL